MAKKSSGKKSVWGKTLSSPACRLIFPAIARPEDFEDDKKFRFKAGLIANPSERLTALIAEVEAVGLKAFGERWHTDPMFARPYVSSEAILNAYKEKHPDKAPSEGMVALYAPGRIRLMCNSDATKGAPECRLADNSMLPRRPGNEADLKSIEDVFYGGAIVTAAVAPYSYNNSAKVRGVTLLLRGVKFIKDAPRLGAADLEAIFGQDVDDAGEWEDEVGATLGEDTPEGELDTGDINV